MAVKPSIVPHPVLVYNFKRFAMHAILIFLNYSSKILNCTLNFKSVQQIVNKLLLLASFSAAGKLFQLVITVLLNVNLPMLE